MDPFAAAFAAAAPLLDEQYGEVVTLERGTSSTEDVLASWIAADAPIVAGPDGATETVDRVWLIAPDAYEIDGGAVTPQRGDRLTDEDGNVWEILPSAARPPVRMTDDGYWAVDTKLIETS